MVWRWVRHFNEGRENVWDDLTELNAYNPLIRHRLHRKFHLQQFITAGMCLLNHCLATTGETHIGTETDGKDLRSMTETGSGATIHIPSFIKTVSGIQKLIGDDTHTETLTAR
jgi:hypothetical protein